MIAPFPQAEEYAKWLDVTCVEQMTVCLIIVLEDNRH
jgi:hypothetical protein